MSKKTKFRDDSDRDADRFITPGMFLLWIGCATVETLTVGGEHTAGTMVFCWAMWYVVDLVDRYKTWRKSHAK